MPEDYLLETTANSDYLKKTDATSTYLTQTNATSTYLTQTNAASTYLTQTNAASTYAPKASPTFTGTISLNGDVTLASASTNTLTLNDHLVLVTGANFTTPASGQQGYSVSATLTTDTLVSNPNISSATVYSYNSGTGVLSLPYGLWIIYGTAGFQVTVPVSSTGTISSVQVGINGNATTISGNYGIKDDSTISVPYSASGTYMSHQVMRLWLVSSSTNATIF